MAQVEDINQRAIELTRAQTTERLIEVLGFTDELMEGLLADHPTEFDHDAYLKIVATRGWIAQVLEERGELDRALNA